MNNYFPLRNVMLVESSHHRKLFYSQNEIHSNKF